MSENTQLIPSPMVVFAIVSPLLAELCEKVGESVTKVMFPLVVVAIGTTGILPLASAVSDAAQYNGFMQTYNMTDYTFTAMDFTIARWPMLILIPAWALFLAPKFMPDKPSQPIAGARSAGQNQRKLSKFSDIAGTVVFFATIIFLVLSDYIGLQSWMVALVGGMLMVLCGTLDTREAMGSALSATGAGEVIGNALANVLGGSTNSYLIGGLFFVVPFIITQFMLNRAVSQIFIPLCILTCQAFAASNGPRPAAVLMEYFPANMTADPMSKLNEEQLADPREVRRAETARLYNAFYCSPEEGKNPLASPAFAPDELLAWFPDTLILSAGKDTLCEEDEELALRMARCGVNVTLRRFRQSPHGFTTNRMGEWEEAVALHAAFLRAHLD